MSTHPSFPGATHLECTGTGERIESEQLIGLSPAGKPLFARYDVDCIIHGHTHRPAVHEMEIDGHKAVRIVLGDWYEQGSVLRWDEKGFELAAL